MVAAFSIPAITVICLGGLDLYKVYNSRQSVRSIFDSATHSAMLDAASADPAQNVKDQIRSVFDDNNSNNASNPVTLAEITASSNTDRTKLKVEATVKVPTPTLSLLGIPSMSYKIETSAVFECKPIEGNYIADSFLNAENEYVVTPDQNWKKGFIWVKTPFDLTKLQSIRLRLYFGTNDANGADGMAFTIQNDNDGIYARGQTGKGLGVSAGDLDLLRIHPFERGNHVVAPAVVVEFDTHRNTQYNDPAEDHTSIFLLGNKQGNYDNPNDFHLEHGAQNELIPLKTLGNIEDGKYHYARFIWDPESSKLIYFFDAQKVGEKSFDLIDFLGSQNALFGFSASTGAKKNLHKACFGQVRIL
jgi:hypothetical protein